MSPLPHGLRHACLLDGEGGLSPLDPSRLDDWSPADGDIWLHLDLTDPAGQEWLTNQSGIDPVAIEALLTVDNLEELIADLEAQVLEATSRETRFGLANLRRQIIALRRYLAPQREALASLVSSKLPWFDDDHRLALRETSDRLIRPLEDLDAIRERAAVTQEELQSRLAEQQNIRMYVLSIVAAIFLPLGFLTGLLGINVGGIPGADNSAAFAIFLGFLVVIVSIQLLFFRLRKWF